jgi:hypothetical protein
MATHKLTDIEIAIRVCPKRVRWPKSDSSIGWTKAHACVDALQNLVRNVDLGCLEAEQDRELSAGGIARRRAELCDQALKKLVNFQPFEIAKKRLTENSDALERLSHRDPEEVQMLQKLTRAFHDLREGIEATKRMVLDRCKMREGAVVNSA